MFSWQILRPGSEPVLNIVEGTGLWCRSRTEYRSKKAELLNAPRYTLYPIRFRQYERRMRSKDAKS